MGPRNGKCLKAVNSAPSSSEVIWEPHPTGLVPAITWFWGDIWWIFLKSNVSPYGVCFGPLDWHDNLLYHLSLWKRKKSWEFSPRKSRRQRSGKTRVSQRSWVRPEQSPQIGTRTGPTTEADPGPRGKRLQKQRWSCARWARQPQQHPTVFCCLKRGQISITLQRGALGGQFGSLKPHCFQLPYFTLE